MISCALPKSDPVGDALQSTALCSTDDDDDDDDDVDVIQWWNPFTRSSDTGMTFILKLPPYVSLCI